MYRLESAFTHNCIMGFVKTRQFCRSLGQFRYLLRNSLAVQKASVLHKSINNTPSDVSFVRGKYSLSFSTSANLKANFEAMSEEDKKEFNIHYKDILEAQKDKNVLIIDVREHSEILETGKLPGSIHIPLGDVIHTMKEYSEKDFEMKYNKQKPSEDTKIVFSCRSGKRSAMAQGEMQKLGFKNVYNYVGGWLDWESNQKV